MITLHDLAKVLLNNNCSNPRDNGFNAYDIELCCMGFRVIAKPPVEYGSDDWEIQDIQKVVDVDARGNGIYGSIVE